MTSLNVLGRRRCFFIKPLYFYMCHVHNAFFVEYNFLVLLDDIIKVPAQRKKNPDIWIFHTHPKRAGLYAVWIRGHYRVAFLMSCFH